MKNILLEICCGSLDDAIEAERGGADRVELCSALSLGGLTPSFGTIVEAKARLKISIMVMIRPRAGGFCYGEAESAAMERDAIMAIEQGADGLVFGILSSKGEIDVERSRRMKTIAKDKQTVFHRAFDVTPEPFKALDKLIDLGITRVLTSGQQRSVPEGVDLIRELREYAQGRIEVLPGGGIKPHNLREVLERTGCNQVHLTALERRTDTSTQARPEITFGRAVYPSEMEYDATNRTLVAEIKSLCRSQADLMGK
jgi:copper homeostasis protein